MGLAEKYIPHYTYNDWIRWEGRWELIDGAPVAMSPAPMPEHQRVVAAVIIELGLALRTSSCKHCSAYDYLDYKISDDTIFEPDVLVVSGKIAKSYLDFPPVLIVEVLSKATEEKDRGIKYDYYEQDGVKYYLIVDTRKIRIEIYQLLNGQYQLQEYKNGFEFMLEEGCIIAPELDNVWE